jgi:hypothetical protein
MTAASLALAVTGVAVGPASTTTIAWRTEHRLRHRHGDGLARERALAATADGARTI